MADVGARLDDAAAEPRQEGDRPLHQEDVTGFIVIAGNGRALGDIHTPHHRGEGKGDGKGKQADGPGESGKKLQARERQAEAEVRGMEGEVQTGREEIQPPQQPGDGRPADDPSKGAGDPPRQTDTGHQGRQDHPEGEKPDHR